MIITTETAKEISHKNEKRRNKTQISPHTQESPLIV